MGLGPPVCQHCQVIGELLKEAVPVINTEDTTTLNTHTYWVCPICGETDLQEYAGFNSENYKRYELNEKFLRFMTGKLKKEK